MGKGRTAVLLKFVFREAGQQVSPVAMSCPSPWLHPVCCYKRPLKEEEELFCFEGLFAFEYWEEAFTLGLLVWELLQRKKNC
jgi:hypothetical protein